MKIKTFKYIILYIVLIFLSIFLVKNFSSFSLYIKNFSDIQKIEETKKAEKIDLNKDFNLANIEKLLSGLNYQDISNLYTIGEKFDKAENIIKSRNKYNYQDFYNLGNIYFLKSYQKFKYNGTGYVENIQNSISYYNYALETIPDYKKKDFILNNLNVSRNFLLYLYFYSCNDFFLKLIRKTNKLFDVFSKLNSIFKLQLIALKKWENNSIINPCIEDFQNEAKQNLSIINTNNTFYNDVKRGIIILMQQYVGEENICYKNKEFFVNKYQYSIDESFKYFSDFLDTQNKMLYIFKKAKLKDMMIICKNKDKLSNKQNKKNKRMMKNFEKLKDLLNQSPHNKKKKEKKQKNSSANREMYNEDNVKSIESKKDIIQKKSKETIQKIQKRKNTKNYNPMNYINRLFSGFYGNKKDFVEGKKQNNVGK